MAVGDIGIWVDDTGSILPTTGSTAFPFVTEDRNDNSFVTKQGTPSNTEFKVAAAGNYLVVYGFAFDDDSNGRCGLMAHVTVNGTNIAGSYSSTFLRDNTSPYGRFSGCCMAQNLAANDLIKVQIWCGSDLMTNGSIAGKSHLQIVRLPDDADSAYASYIGSGTSAMGGTTWTDFTLATVRESDTAVIQRSTNDIQLKGTSTRYLVTWGMFYLGATTRTQRITRLVDGSTLIPASYSHTYIRTASTQYQACAGAVIIETGGTTMNLSIQGQRGNADSDGSAYIAGGGCGIQVWELPADVECGRWYDGSGGQDVATVMPLLLTAFTTPDFEDTASFEKYSSTAVELKSTGDFLVLSSCFATRTDTSGTRLFRQHVVRDNSAIDVPYAESCANSTIRGNQSSIDTYDMCTFLAAVIEWPSITGAGQYLKTWIKDDGYDGGSADDTIADGVGIHLLNLSTLGGAATQTITPSVVTVAVNEQSPTVSLGALTLGITFPRVLTSELFSPTVDLTLTIAPDVTYVQVVPYAVTIAHTLSLTPSVISSPISVQTPTVLIDQSFAPDYSVPLAIYAAAPTLVMGELVLTPSVVAVDLDASPAPTIAFGTLALTPTQETLDFTLLAVTVSLGASPQTLTPSGISFPLNVQAPNVAIDQAFDPDYYIPIVLYPPAPTVVLGTLTLAPDVETLDLNEQAPTIALGTLTLGITFPRVLESNLYSPSVDLTLAIAPDADALDANVQDPVVAPGTLALTPTQETLDFTVVAPTVSIGSGPQTKTPTEETLDLDLQAPTVALGTLTLTPSVDTLDLNAQAVSVTFGTSVSPDAETLTLTVQTPTVSLTLAITPDTETFDFTLAVPTLGLTLTITQAWNQTVFLFGPDYYPPTVVLGTVALTVDTVGLDLTLLEGHVRVWTFEGTDEREVILVSVSRVVILECPDRELIVVSPDREVELEDGLREIVLTSPSREVE